MYIWQIWRHVTVHRDKFLIIELNRCTNFSNLFLEWNSTCFRQLLCPSPGVFHCTHSNGISHTGLLTACEQDQDVPYRSCSQAVSKPAWLIPLLCVQWKTPDDGQRNCPKHVEFHSKNKFEKLVHLFSSFIRKVHLTASPISTIYVKKKFFSRVRTSTQVRHFILILCRYTPNCVSQYFISLRSFLYLYPGT